MIAAEALAPPPNGILARLRQAVDALVELDFTRPIAFAALSVAFIASRLLWLDHGYGTDPDSWRVALSGYYLRTNASYLPSRLPGYPLHEFVTAGIGEIRDGWIWTNLSTVIISVVCVYLFALLLKKLDVPHRGALAVAFAFAPLLWINSATTMDYMWALTFILAAYLALLNGQVTLAGIALGVAAGFRLTSFAMLPVFWLLIWRTHQRGQIRPLTFTALAVALGLYTPVLMDYGLNFLNFYDQKVPLGEFVRHLGKDGLGVLGALAVVVAVIGSARRFRAVTHDLRHDPQVLVWTAAIAIYFVSYVRLPHEIAYLIPLFPFGFFLMGRYLSRGLLLFALAAIVVAGFVDVTSHDNSSGINISTFTKARLGQGMLLSNIDTQDNQLDFARELRGLTATNPNMKRPAVVIVGFIYPELAMLYRNELSVGILEHDYTAISQLSDRGVLSEHPSAGDPCITICYVWLLDYDTFQQFRSENKNIYITTDAERSTYAVYHYRPAYFGALELPLSRSNPSLGKGAVNTNR